MPLIEIAVSKPMTDFIKIDHGIKLREKDRCPVPGWMLTKRNTSVHVNTLDGKKVCSTIPLTVNNIPN